MRASLEGRGILTGNAEAPGRECLIKLKANKEPSIPCSCRQDCLHTDGLKHRLNKIMQQEMFSWVTTSTVTLFTYFKYMFNCWGREKKPFSLFY